MKYTNHTRKLQIDKIGATVRMRHDVHIRVDVDLQCDTLGSTTSGMVVISS